MDSAADVHVCNDKHLMTEYRELPTRVGGSTSNGVSPGRGKVKLRPPLKDGSEGLILNLVDAFYLPNSPCSLVSLGCLDDSGIYYNNADKNLDHIKSRQVLAQVLLLNNSYLLIPLNLSDNNYKWPPGVLRTSSSSRPLSLTTWHKRLGHVNTPLVKKTSKSSRHWVCPWLWRFRVVR